MTTIAQLLQQGRQRLEAASPTPALDAELLLAHAIDRPRSYLYAWPEATVDTPKQTRFQRMLERRQAGCPMAYLLGWREFWSREFQVRPGVLIPRPETEGLVELALELIPRTIPWHVADLGTGSGAIAITLALERPASHVVATDISVTALAVAQANAHRLGAGNVTFLRGDWLASLAPATLELIVSNPPYVAATDSCLEGEIRFEPRTALVGGDDGLEAFRHLIPQALPVLKPGGWLLLEHGYRQAEAVTALLQQAGFRNISTHPDFQGHFRITQAQKGIA